VALGGVSAYGGLGICTTVKDRAAQLLMLDLEILARNRCLQTASNLHRQAVTNSPPTTATIAEKKSLIIVDDYDDDDMDPWGDMDDGFGTKPSSSINKPKAKASSMETEDDVINSFSSKPKSTLPKGLAAKKPASAVRSASGTKTGGAVRPISKTTIVPKAKSEPKPNKVEDVDADAWGAWD